MRVESSVTAVSWIPSEAIKGIATKLPFDSGVAHYDDPPPDVLTDPGAYVGDDRARFANELRAWIDVTDGRVTGFGHAGGCHINVSTLHLGKREMAFQAVGLPTLRPEPVVDGDTVRFVQTAGGRTGLPAPRRVSRPPYVQIAAPLAWTTLALTIRADGSSEFELAGASPFPRHWIYDAHGRLAAKSGLIDFKTWYREAFGEATPWGDQDSRALVSEVETALERELSRSIMRAGAKPKKRKVKEGETLVEQGEPGAELFLLLDGILSVAVDGEVLAEIGPGAVLGERAVLEGSRRTSTLRAVTPCRVAVVPADALDREALVELSRGHRREEG